MAYDEQKANQIRELIAGRTDNVVEKTMFGGLCFMVEDKICVGIKKDTLLVRIAPDVYDLEVEKDGRVPMSHSGKPVKTYLFVDYDEIRSARDLAYWVNLCLDYNPLAPLSQAKQKAKAKKQHL
jgi:TfoX/Sxy family transcriptional regulator of competence genes